MQYRSLPLSANWLGQDPESLLWLASYPRSGNTFTRILLANYLLAGEEDYDINALTAFCPADTDAGLWQAYASRFSAPADLHQTWHARRRAFDHYRRTRSPASFPGLKTHTGNILAYGTDGFDARPNDRVIYIVRHPLDVAVSFADFNGKDMDAAIDELCTPSAYVRDERLGAFELRGSWAEHVENWLFAPPCELLLLRYETLCADTATCLRSILDFLGVPVIEERVIRAVEASRFDRLRDQESAKSFKEAPTGSTSGRFFRQGGSLQWRTALAPDQALRLADACGPLMLRLGYTHPRDVRADGGNALGPMTLPLCAGVTAVTAGAS